MKTFIFILLIGVLLVYILCDSREKRKLQIGIKNRVLNCVSKTKKGDLLHVKYKGTFENDEEFDSSGDRVFSFTLGAGQVIKGWDQGLMGMCVGEVRKLVVPPDLAYGRKGVPPTIPGDTTLIFNIKLVDLEKEKH